MRPDSFPFISWPPPPSSVENKGFIAAFACKLLLTMELRLKLLQAKELGTAVDKEQTGARPGWGRRLASGITEERKEVRRNRSKRKTSVMRNSRIGKTKNK